MIKRRNVRNYENTGNSDNAIKNKKIQIERKMFRKCCARIKDYASYQNIKFREPCR